MATTTPKWHDEYDFIVIGSGAGGMSGGVAAAALGLKALVLEKTDQFGGTTALSGGVIWIPNNASMKAGGINDSEAEALDYLKHVVGPDVPEEKLRAYISGGVEMLDFFDQHADLRFDAALKYSDYYPTVPGAKPGGRSMEPEPISRRRIGKHAAEQRFPDFLKSGVMRFAITVKESREVMDMTFKGKMLMLRNILRYYLDIPSRLKGLPDNRQTLGRALVVRLRRALLSWRVPLWLNTEVQQLLTEEGRVVGVSVVRDGKQQALRARHGVLFASGGMGQNVALRQQFGQLPTGETFSSDAPGNVGDAVRLGQAVGADLAFMQCAWWTPSVKFPDGSVLALISGKAMPGSIFIDSRGKRFCNEAAPYEDVIKMLWDNHSKGNDSVPCHMVFDARARREYMMGPIPPGKIQKDSRLPPEWFESGFLSKAVTLDQLAEQIGVPAQVFSESIVRHNDYALRGEDPDFQRGASAIDRYYGDQSVQPNPSLAPIAEPPFYALKVYPGDLGTKGGLKTNEHAQVMDVKGSPIPGLYATGNCSGAVMGDSYPGAGSTIGPAMTFAYLAARHAARRHTANAPERESTHA
ncbi:3-oxosteroid 1-dehydrogenase [Litorivivens lipolytica]|uniref:3-oxosteroid 1-dehydrogenase n=1 Tax=Litorivivens lipolytica TaxID=1524264 RepID=A0A7W4W6A0_9GAMM|nr:FAD-binding protein [Litorivivens lipolytica]MBB3048247.1 3-oxosteroid 1-dehydrogenase [Litorivivens lipolytica]